MSESVGSTPAARVMASKSVRCIDMICSCHIWWSRVRLASRAAYADGQRTLTEVERVARQTRQGNGDPLWRLARSRGLNRRRFLTLLLAGGTAAVLAACGDAIPERSGGADQSVASVEPPLVFKDPTPFIDHGQAGLEARLELQTGSITSNEQFFVRNNSRSVDLDIERWSLVIEGDAVDEGTELRFDDILRLPQRRMTSYLECAGNHRVMFDLLQGRAAKGTQWGRGAIGNAEWTGVSLADLLTLAGVQETAVSVLLIGLDPESPEGGFRRAMPIVKAMHPDTLLVHRMNDEPLPTDHGFPLRAIVPGWVGSSQIKWLGRIVVSAEPQWTRNNTTSYVLIGDEYEPEGEADGRVVTLQSIKSALALPWPARLSATRHQLAGYAHSPYGEIASVEWSDDAGTTWHRARLASRQVEYGWVQFAFEWNASVGEHTIRTRATDMDRNTQPESVPFNEKGYLFNQPLPHPISVA
ncbi:MAG: molybdopterin-dependent oxidoreductase [Chloroflexi bacterium]|nr:molybdopterin-dependent oxidoreductase [Chloroflexota bacterium]MYJ58816.1 molybdopterin-dependent oxidoreductase [Chloroflexota bacterium]